MTDREFLEREIAKWKGSPKRVMQIKGSLYYDNEHDILKRKRTMIGEDGKLQVVDNLPNNRVIDNQYAKMVNQKANYLFGQPFAIECQNEQYGELLKKVFNKRFMKTLKNSGKAAYNGGIAWLYPYYTEEGEFAFRLFPAYEILPFWKDNEHTILVLKNYDGTNLGEFRKNLATYGAVKIRYDESAKGGVETLEITVNAENYKAILEIFKKALIENAMGYDAKDDRLSGNPNQMNIQSMYSDIDIDANDTETEYQAAFEEILWFVNAHLANMGKGDYEGEDVTIIFNRDILMNESEVIDNCQKSVGILSDETIIGQHPWVDDPKAEMERLEKQKQKEQEEMLKQYDPFGQHTKNPADPNQGNQGGGVDEE